LSGNLVAPGIEPGPLDLYPEAVELEVTRLKNEPIGAIPQKLLTELFLENAAILYIIMILFQI
jgi:hypothetical protein